MAAFNVQDLVVTLTLNETGNAKLDIATCTPSKAVAFGSCGFTQKLCPKVEMGAGRITYGMDGLDELRQLRDALSTMIATVTGIEQALELPVPADVKVDVKEVG